MARIQRIEINQFRAIKQLTVSELSNINLIVGDNNSGKTTFLEAVQLLFAKPQLSAVRNIMNQRTVLNPVNSSFYTSFINLFNVEQRKDQLNIDIYGEASDGAYEFELRGSEKEISGEDALKLSAQSSRQKTQWKRSGDLIPETAKLFTGEIIAQVGKKPIAKDVRCTSLDSGTPGPAMKKEIHCISSFGHLRYDLLQNVVENPEYKNLAISVLRQFDESIADICYTKADDGTYLETIVTRNGKNMPFSVYGDGIKKILYIMNKLFDASNSILLIDEIETGLHKKYYETLFPVVFALAEKLNVQLFIATHSMEAIEAILGYGNYEDAAPDPDPIKVITFKKIVSEGESKIVARNVTGKYVYENRKAFAFEVRL